VVIDKGGGGGGGVLPQCLVVVANISQAAAAANFPDSLATTEYLTAELGIQKTWAKALTTEYVHGKKRTKKHRLDCAANHRRETRPIPAA
jgi:hypothetical protein